MNAEELRIAMSRNYWGISSDKSENDYTLIAQDGGIGDEKRVGKLVYFEYTEDPSGYFSSVCQLRDRTFLGPNDESILSQVKEFFEARNESIQIYSPMPNAVLRSFEVEVRYKGELSGRGSVYYLRPKHIDYKAQIGDQLDQKIMDKVAQEWRSEQIEVSISKPFGKELAYMAQYHEELWQKRGKYYRPVTVSCDDIQTNRKIVDTYGSRFLQPIPLRMLFIIRNDSADMKTLDSMLDYNFDIEVDSSEYNLLTKFNNKPAFLASYFTNDQL